MDRAFKGTNWGTDQIDLRNLGKVTVEIKPVEVHMRENGSIGNRPSFAIVAKDGFGCPYVMQISLEMFNQGLADIGYKCTKI